MKNIIIDIIIGGLTIFALSFYVDMEITRRDYLSRTDLRQQISGCRFETNCRHYNKLLNHTEYNKEDWEME